MSKVSNEEEIDYMSDDFLVQCEKSDIRPGLMDRENKRKHELQKRKMDDDQQNRKKIKSQTQEETLQSGLNTALGSSNKGFELLQKMGYKPGMSLGKDNKGRLEPVPVDLKNDRKGLGWKHLIEEKRKAKEILRKKRENEKQEQFDPNEYRARQSMKHQIKLITIDLAKSTKACMHLDQNEGILEPHEYWFWPDHTWNNDDDEDYSFENEDDVEIEFSPAEKLEILTEYLRDSYLFCSWCGRSYENLEDMNNECPGNTRSDHDY